MPFQLPNAKVVEDFSMPMVLPDQSAIIEIYTYVNDSTKPISTRTVTLSPEQMNEILALSPSGSNLKEAIGSAVLRYLSENGETTGRFPEDYIVNVSDYIV